jgi:replication factor C subunit 1
VVLGSDAGPKKLETIRKNKIPTINEDGLFQLIRSLPARGGGGKAGEVAAAKKAAEEEKIRDMAREMDERAKPVSGTTGEKNVSQAATQLWTEKYAPTSMKDMIGNKGLVEKLQRWLHDWYEFRGGK